MGKRKPKSELLTPGAVKNIWASLESIVPTLAKHRKHQIEQEAALSKVKFQKKEKNKAAQIATRAKRESNKRSLSNKLCKKEHFTSSEKSKQTAKETTDDRHSLHTVASVIPRERVFNYERLSISRSFEIEVQRSQLPVVRHECEIMESLFDNGDKTCVIICGGTGTGKTTQVPQFLLEHGFPATIAITQPRRVAVYAMARRLRDELNMSTEVGYQVRHEKSVDPKLTRVKFMTEGILLREIQQDFALHKYSAVIIDEVHERSVDCDILIGLLSRIIPLRSRMGNPLAVILMSATMDISILTKNSSLFRQPPPVISIESRRFPLCEHYSLKSSTTTTYLDDAFLKCVQIHTRLPYGAILCFVPTQKDCEWLSQRLLEHFHTHRTRPYRKGQNKVNVGYSRKEKHDIILENSGDGEHEFQMDSEASEDLFDLNESLTFNSADSAEYALDTLYALPLYATLEESRQRLVFSEIPDGKRLCVIATNVAETSLTIPEVRYVVDTGFVKERNYEANSNTFCSRIVRISISSACQRAGRAGRTMPGHVYRLFSPGCYGRFSPSTTPEIERTPIERVVLFLSSFEVNVLKFPFPTAISPTGVLTAIQKLKFLGALDSTDTANKQGRITELGKKILELPVVPRLAVILLRSAESAPVIRHFLINAVAVATSTLHLFQPSNDLIKKRLFESPGSDYLSFAKFLYAFHHSKRRKKLCRYAMTSYAVAHDSYMLSMQLHRILGVDPRPELKFEKKHEIAFRKALCFGFLDCVARKVASTTDSQSKALYEHRGKMYRLHPSSQCSRVRPFPEWIIFSSIEAMANRKDRLRGLTIVSIDWLYEMGYAE